ncbi:hypothetical protein [Nocardiopsis sp. NRRL B-16309]|uniref:hypothetical protein n=1 Tax=Nocardiopsis sp. NRRL B-16309 TaxID=1519494 RepID=UPI0006ADACEE|nr:hypothetical protein [Nocardiopsis sp. NRRL B-16309]KOX10219.1 hypothetical protein ADL05_26515 [Nocardiopsis sp. NRRL B-16309]
MTSTTGADWTTRTLPTGRQYTSTRLGSVSVGGTTADVVVYLDPGWFTRGRARGRAEEVLHGANLTTGPGFTEIGYRVEHQEIDPDAFLSRAPADLARLRPGT